MNGSSQCDLGRELQVRRAVRRVLRESCNGLVASSAVALVLAAPISRSQEAGQGSASNGIPMLQEIVVSAQRRTESLQNVPYNISAISGSTLQDSGAVSMNDLTQAVPGLTSVDQGPAARAGNNTFILRGLRTDAPGGGSAGLVYQNLTTSPVSTYFGETPVFFQMPLDDLERVEVLRGPQGTLYGSGSQAGTIRFIPRRPMFGSFSGQLSADGSYTRYSPNANGSVHGVVNIPLADHLAVRVVAGEEHQAGFIDAVDRVQLDSSGAPSPSVPGDLTSGFVLQPVRRGVNTSDQYFARAAVRWQPAESVDLQLEYLHEHTSMADSQWGSAWPGGPFDTSFGIWPLAPVNTRPGCNFCTTNWVNEPYSDKTDLTDLVGTFDVGLGTVTSATSYYDSHNVTNYDQTGGYYGTANPPNPNASFLQFYPYLGYPRITAPIRAPAGSSSFVQEIRLVSNPGKYFDYVVGLYYQRQHSSINLAQAIPGIRAYDDYIGQPNPSAFGDSIYFLNRTTELVDKAAFGELTYHLTRQWQVTGGVRYFQQPFYANITSLLPLCGAICSQDQVNPQGLETFSTATQFKNHVWKLNSSYDLSPTLKVYATFSEGFRHGGVSGLPAAGPFASPSNLQTFSPDLAKNYELGVKGSFFEHRLDFFADVYWVNLDNFQFDTLNLSQVAGAFNGTQARSEGFEFESRLRLTDGLDTRIGYAFTRAYVKSSFDVLDYPPYSLIPSQGGTGQLASLFGGAIAAGTPLPGVSRHIVNASMDYSFQSSPTGSGNWMWKAHLDGSYRSSQNSNISPTSIYEFTIPSAFLANALVSLNTGGPVSYSFFVRNITNNPDITGGVNDQKFANPYRLRNVGRPRTVGLGVRFEF